MKLMPSAKSVAFVLAFFLAVPVVAVLGEEGRPEGSPGPSGATTARDNATMERERGTSDDDMREVAREQHEEREGFRERLEEARETCHRMNHTEEGRCEGRLHDEQRQFNEEQRERFEEQRERMREAREEEKLGRFALVNGTFVGRFVTFAWDAPNATVRDFTVGGVHVFDRIQLIGTGTAQLEVERHGRQVDIEAGRARLKLHDNPGGVIVARAPASGSVAFAFDASLTLVPNGSAVRASGPGDFTAVLRGHNLTLTGDLASVDREAVFVARERNPAHPAAADDHRDEVEQAKAERRVGAEVNVVGPDDEDVDEVELDADLRVETRSGENRVRVVVSGTGLGPRAIVVNLAAGVLGSDRVVVRYFDEADGTFVEVPIREAHLSIVLHPDTDGPPAFAAVRKAGSVQLVVSVPRFSIHAFEVQGVLEELPPSVLLGLGAGAVLVVAASAALVRRRP